MEARHAVEIDRKTPLGVLSFVSAVLSLALLVASLRPPPSAAPADLLADALSHRALYGLFASLVLAWSVFSGGVAKCRVAQMGRGGRHGRRRRWSADAGGLPDA